MGESRTKATRRRPILKALVGVLSTAMLVLLGLAIAKADSADPKLPFAGTAVVDPVTHKITVTLTGGWTWPTHHSDCNTDRFGVGWAVDWNDDAAHGSSSPQPGNVVGTVGGVTVDVGAAAGNANNPADNLVHYSGALPRCGAFNAGLGYNEGQWGQPDQNGDPTTHTYPAGMTSIDVCVVTYDIHFGNKNAGTANPNDLVAGGNNHAHDNSVQSNKNTPLGNGCFLFQVPTLTTTADTNVTAGNPVDDTAHISGGTTSPKIGTPSCTPASPAGCGELTFNAYSDANCNTSVYTSVVDVNGNGDYTASSGTGGAFTPGAGTYKWIASYAGDDHNAATSGACGDAGETSVVNRGPLGEISIVKVANPAGPTTFDFDTAGSAPALVPATFTLADPAQAGGPSNEQDYPSLTNGSYVFTETEPAGWSLNALDCSGNTNSTVTKDTANNKVTVDLVGAEHVTCTYTNNKDASITIVKNAVPDSSQSFGFSAPSLNPNSFSLVDDGINPKTASTTYSKVTPGTYTVSENVTAGWNLNSISCSDPTANSTGNTGTRTATINVAVGEDITCTFTNNKPTSSNPPVPHPGINIVKDGPALAHVGDTVHYTFAVTNVGDVPLTGIVVSDPRCDAAPTLDSITGGNQDTTLDLTETWHYSCDHVVTSADPDPLPNTATVTAAQGVSDQSSHSVDIIHPAITIVKTANPTSAAVGTTITYTYTVTNSGDVTLTNVSVDDDKLGHIGDIATLAAGQTVTLTKTAVLPAGGVTNVGTAAGTDPLGKVVNAHDDATVGAVAPAVVAQTPPPAEVKAAELARTGHGIDGWLIVALFAMFGGLLFLAGGELVNRRAAYAEALTAKPDGGKHYAPEARIKTNLRLGITVLAAGLISRTIRRKR